MLMKVYWATSSCVLLQNIFNDFKMTLLALTLLFGVVAAAEKEQVVNKEFLDGYNKFTSDVYNELKKTNPESFVVSPLSVDIGLSLSEYGARGETSKELVKGLSLPENKEKLREAITSLIPKLNVSDKYTLTSANKIYVSQDIRLLENFQKFATEVYNAPVENINFYDRKPATKSMNKWVEDKTLQKIKDLINEDDIGANTRTVILNALYFRGNWITKFDSEKTGKGDFYLDSSNKIDVDFMQVKSNFKYYENHYLKAKFLELPYDGDDVTLTIALPTTKDGIKDLENKIAQVLDSTNYEEQLLNVKIPKFKIESKIGFVPILENLGIHTPFTDLANFAGITGESLKISNIVQKSLIEVDEVGTTAAASSAVIIFTRSGSMQEKYFIADHPFIFVLKYKSVVLFIGHYTGK